MKLLLIPLICILFFSCENDHVPSGVDVNAYYSKCVDSNETVNYTPYNGILYFVPANDYPKINLLSWDSLKIQYKSSVCEEGKTSSFLSPGDYILEPDSFINALSPVMIVIEPDVLLETEYYLIDCR
jgi:hypothetical protein